MAVQGDLTTLANVTAWLNAGSTTAYPPDDNALLSRLITAASRYIKSYLSANIVPAQYSETRNGSGTSSMFLRNRPVVSVISLTVDGDAVQASNPPPNGAGYLFDDTRIYMPGTYFPACIQNVTVVYVAGYQTSDPVTVPTNGEALPVSDLEQVWNCDRGVALNGTAMTPVASNPVAGQYSLVTQKDGSFAYVFSASDAGLPAVVTYGYTPQDLEQAVIELVCERFKTRSRIGQVSQNMGNGQVVSYSQKDMNDNVRTLLQQYKSVVPV